MLSVGPKTPLTDPTHLCPSEHVKVVGAAGVGNSHAAAIFPTHLKKRVSKLAQ